MTGYCYWDKSAHLNPVTGTDENITNQHNERTQHYAIRNTSWMPHSDANQTSKREERISGLQAGTAASYERGAAGTLGPRF